MPHHEKAKHNRLPWETKVVWIGKWTRDWNIHIYIAWEHPPIRSENSELDDAHVLYSKTTKHVAFLHTPWRNLPVRHRRLFPSTRTYRHMAWDLQRHQRIYRVRTPTSYIRAELYAAICTQPSNFLEQYYCRLQLGPKIADNPTCPKLEISETNWSGTNCLEGIPNECENDKWVFVQNYVIPARTGLGKQEKNSPQRETPG